MATFAEALLYLLAFILAGADRSSGQTLGTGSGPEKTDRYY